jgi:hypothetical protein
MRWLLVAVDLIAPGFVPWPLRGLYARTIGAAAAAERDRWEAAGDDWGEAA